MSEAEEKVGEDGSNSPPTTSSSEPAETERKSLSNSDSPQAAASSESSDPKQKSNLKVDILLKPAGDAPIMKKKKWTVERSKKICGVANFIKKYIKSEPSESLFLYVNQSFAPSPDTDIGSIFDCFGSDGKLVLHYCRTQAWG